MEKTIRCAKCQEKFEVVGSTEKSKATRDVTISVKCMECDAINDVAWPDGMRYFVRKAD
jgi:phage FluMu protein Com